MITSINKENIVPVIAVLLTAICTFYFVQELTIVQLLGLSSIVIIVVFTALKPHAVLFLLFALKPFIDMTWNASLFSVGEMKLSALHIVGFYVFFITAYLYFFQQQEFDQFNRNIIWIFLAINLFTSLYTILFFKSTLVHHIDGFLRIFDAYMIYFVFSRYMHAENKKLSIIRIIWISTTLVTTFSLIVYLTGNYHITMEQNVVRFAGVYNDPGMPSYTAVISLIFGTLYLELLKRKKIRPLIYKMIYLYTSTITAIILVITITKSAILMFAIFIIMWFGFYKKKLILIIPLVILGSILIYSSSQTLQTRMKAETDFFSGGEFTIEAARPLGTGRVAFWERVLTHYANNFNLFQKLFGSSANYGAHNQYIAYLMQVGILGLFVFLIIVVRFFLKLVFLFRKYKKPDIFAALMVLVIFLAVGVIGHTFSYTTLLWDLMILLSLVNVGHKTDLHSVVVHNNFLRY
ncbi:O-antigen ligase family protein [Acidobacteriota bacterium]